MAVSEQNWAGNYTFTAVQIHRPESIDALRHLVAAAPKIRAIGSRHSFNGIADSPGELVDLAALASDIALDREAMTVTVGAATSYGALADWLHRRGYALHNLASLPHITVAGGISTGTHGSGDRNGPLSSAVAGLELVLADGSLCRVGRGDEGFDGMVVGLGAFGIVTRVVLTVEPTFDVRQDSFVNLAWDDLLANFEAISSAAYSVSIMTKWSNETADRLWLKTRLTADSPSELAISHLGLRAGPPEAVSVADVTPSPQLTAFGGVPGPWSERLAHFRPDSVLGGTEQIQSEYMIPRMRLAEAVTAIRAMAGRVDACLRAAEIRTMAADAFWLSPAYCQDSVGLHFTWHKRPAEVDAITQELEDRLIPLGARPHWGKVLHADAATLMPLYPRLAQFRALATRYDPSGKFRNAFMDRHVFG
jgi:xylitol oxidase